MDWRLQSLCCYACGAVAAVGGDLPEERGLWPPVPCEATPGCPGAMVPAVQAAVAVGR